MRSEGRGSPAQPFIGVSRLSNTSDSERPRRRTDNVDVVLRRKAEAEKIMAARRAALIAEQNEKMKRINEHRDREKKDRARLHAEKELKRQKEALDRRTAYLEAQNQKKEAILAKAHASASRTAALNKNKPCFAFGSSTPREISYLQTVPKDQRAYDKKLSPTAGPPPPASPQPSTANATPSRAGRTSMMTSSMYVPNGGANKVSRPPRLSATPRFPIKSVPVNNLMTQSMYTPTSGKRDTTSRSMRSPPTSPSAHPRSSNGPNHIPSSSQKRVSHRVSSSATKPVLPARAKRTLNGNLKKKAKSPNHEEDIQKKDVVNNREQIVEKEKAQETVKIGENAEEHTEVEVQKNIEEDQLISVQQTLKENAHKEELEKTETPTSVAHGQTLEESTLIDFEDSQTTNQVKESENTTDETVQDDFMQISLHDELAALMENQSTISVDGSAHDLIEVKEVLHNEIASDSEPVHQGYLLMNLVPHNEQNQEIEAQHTNLEPLKEQQLMVTDVLETETPKQESNDGSSPQNLGEILVSLVTNQSQDNASSVHITPTPELVVRPTSPAELRYEEDENREIFADDPVHKKVEEIVAPIEHAPPTVPLLEETLSTPADPEVKKCEERHEKSENVSPTSGSPPGERRSEILVKYEQEEKEREARKARLAAIMNRMRGGTNDSPPNGTTNGAPQPVPSLDATPAMAALQRVAALSNNPRISQVVSKHASNPNLEDAALPGAVPEPPQDPLIIGSHHQNGIPSQL